MLTTSSFIFSQMIYPYKSSQNCPYIICIYYYLQLHKNCIQTSVTWFKNRFHCGNWGILLERNPQFHTLINDSPRAQLTRRHLNSIAHVWQEETKRVNLRATLKRHIRESKSTSLLFAPAGGLLCACFSLFVFASPCCRN